MNKRKYNKIPKNIFSCPICLDVLKYKKESFICQNCKKTYIIKDNIVVLV